jgi:hypothetical protein
MKVYLAKFTIGERSIYKIGHTKYFQSIKRFEDPQYDKFDFVKILDDIYIEHRDAQVARQMAKLVEACLQAYFPKDFRLEEFFQTEDGFFNNLSGITECFILNSKTEKDVVEMFRQVKREVGYIINESREHRWKY